MATRDRRIDEYIARAPEFAKPILIHIRRVVHAACPDVVETLKWSSPSFEYKGLMCGMAAFKQHATFGFWKHPLVTGAPREKGSMGFSRLTKVSDLPSNAVLTAYVKKAMALNEQGIQMPRTTKPPKPLAKTPADLAAALKTNAKAKANYEAFSPSAKREYVDWITGAKGADTRARRVVTAVEWIGEGKQRNWKYM